jgi:drug/metabolite transporter (DMT)-like permease
MWGISFVSTKVLLNLEMQPVEIYIYRFTLAYLLILIFKRSKLFSQNWRDEGLLMLCGILAGSIYFLAENFALRYTLVSNVSLLTSTSPLITTLLIGVMYKAERPGSGMIIGSLVALAGVGCVIFNSSFNLEIRPLGDILALAGAFSWALYSLILKKLNALYDVWFITRKTFFYGVLTSLPFLYVEPPRYNVMEIFTISDLWINLLFLGLGASLVAYVLWASTVKKVGAVKANNYLYLQPIITLVVSAVLLNEHVSVVGFIGCIMILVGLWLGDYLNRRQQLKK